MELRKIIVLLFVLVLLFYTIRLSIFTKRSQKSKTYTFAVLIGGISLIAIGTFLDMIVYMMSYEIIYILIKICFTLGAGIYILGVILWSNYTQEIIKQLEGFLLTDFMTGVLNRNGIEKIYNMHIKAKNSFYVIVCDLDGTKIINDGLGHLVGDDYITSTTKIMTDIIGLKGHIARIGGDEFIIIIEYIDVLKLQQIISKIKQAVYEILPEKNSGVSSGYSSFPDDGVTFEELIKVADKKMYDDKKSKKI
ncbi:GGDEF domain-containing protein [Clostridium sp.]|uniref:GGDEF domain-containing protein n=1 Tax=Clostridium sp. TaxID=1506 RepID=UPI0025C28111|nr:GGDEF domain-containing protein [Clostridium sp.]